MNHQSTEPTGAGPVADALAPLAPDTVEVDIVPVWTPRAGRLRRAHRVWLLDTDGQPCGTIAAARAALAAIREEHPDADWDRAHRYDVRASRLSLLDQAAADDVAGGDR